MLGKKIDRKKTNQENSMNEKDIDIDNNYIENNYWINLITPRNLDFLIDL